MTHLWRVKSGNLIPVATTTLQTESLIHDWLERDPKILGLDLLIIAREYVIPGRKGRVDLLALDQDGDLTVIELKRDMTPREAIAQVLDYGSWISDLTTPEVHRIARDYLKRPLSEAFQEKFGDNIPDTLNGSHNLLIVASALDPSSQRIVKYLAETYGVSINTAFFTSFRDSEGEYLAADWLLDPEVVMERSDDRTKAPWTGYYYVNIGHDPDNRVWDDMQKYGFVAAGYGRFYSGRLDQLTPGDQVFAYHKGEGYVGYGVVRSAAVMAKDFVTTDGKRLQETSLQQPNILHHTDNPEMADYIVGVDWKKTFPLNEAKWISGGFANQNVVCKLRHPATLDFLTTQFDVDK